MRMNCNCYVVKCGMFVESIGSMCEISTILSRLYVITFYHRNDKQVMAFSIQKCVNAVGTVLTVLWVNIVCFASS